MKGFDDTFRTIVGREGWNILLEIHDSTMEEPGFETERTLHTSLLRLQLIGCCLYLFLV